MFSGIVAHAAAEEHRNRVAKMTAAPSTLQQSSTSLNYHSFDDDDDCYCNSSTTSTQEELEQQEIDRQDARLILSNYHKDFPPPLFDRSVVSADTSDIVEEDDSLEDMKTAAKAFIPVATDQIGIVAASTHTHLLTL